MAADSAASLDCAAERRGMFIVRLIFFTKEAVLYIICYIHARICLKTVINA